jgi:hypothetical protein
MVTIVPGLLVATLTLVAPAGSQRARPTADVAAGGWATQAGATTSLYAVLDETTIDDADYLRSTLSPETPDEVKLRLAPLVDPGRNVGHVLRYRYGKSAAAGDTLDLTVTLYAADGTTVIASAVQSEIGATVAFGTLELSPAEADAIPAADYATGLVVGFAAALAAPANVWDFSQASNSAHLLTAGVA